MAIDFNLAQATLPERVYRIMELLPDDKVTTYGDVAALAGHPYAARVVGGIANRGPSHLAWHRLVNKSGGLARGFPGGPEVQKQLLKQDGFRVTDFRIDNFEAQRWRPLA